jgi:sugar phosphate isomerase/epimerase
MINRRDFIKATSGALVFSLPGMRFGSGLLAARPAPGVQLYTFFDVLDADTEGTLKKMAGVGVKNIESAFSRKGDYYGMPAGDFKAMIDQCGMKWLSHHVLGAPLSGAGSPPPKTLRDNLPQVLEDAAAGGWEYIVAAHLPIGTRDQVKASLDILNAAAGPCKKAGVQLVYHNEPADFKVIDGKTPYEVFLNGTDPEALKFELDIAWAVKGGQAPEALFDQYPGRFPLWHIKDLSKDYSTVLPVGEGVLDYYKYFSLADRSGLKYYFIEHESPKDALASVSESIATIRAYSK